MGRTAMKASTCSSVTAARAAWCLATISCSTWRAQHKECMDRCMHSFVTKRQARQIDITRMCGNRRALPVMSSSSRHVPACTRLLLTASRTTMAGMRT